MGKRIAVIFSDNDIFHPRGMVNAIDNRIRELTRVADCEIVVFVIHQYYPWYVRLIKPQMPKFKRVKKIDRNGITYNILWYPFTLTDWFLVSRLKRNPLLGTLFNKQFVRYIKGFDLITAHSDQCGRLAQWIAKRDSIPYFITWHGSDIHTSPFQNDSQYEQTKNLLEGATCNFFVSKALQDTALGITNDIKSEVLYNGRNELFCRYSDEKRKNLRIKYGVEDNTKVIAFVGNLIEVKNPHLLAPIFSEVRNHYQGKLLFWIIGKGKLSSKVVDACSDNNLPFVYWGGQDVEYMPDFMNCMDVLVLPSRNEGLPLVTVEALSCGANVVGADVGGIGEAIGKENVFPHGENFVTEVSKRIVYMLNNKVAQQLKEDFEWKHTALIEKGIYEDALSH